MILIALLVNSAGLISSSLRNLNPSNESPTQAAVIVPDPANPGVDYYTFSLPGVLNTLGEGIRYSLYEGATQSFPNITNQPPVTNYDVTEHLAAVPHCNGTDYWVIYHGAAAAVQDKFLAYQVSAAGVASSPVMSNSFSVPVPRSGNDWIGQIDVAPNGRYMAVTEGSSNLCFLYELDRATGQITFINTVAGGNINGHSFSPNSEFLYITGSYGVIKQYKVQDMLTCGGAIPFKTASNTRTATGAGPSRKMIPIL